MRLADNNMKKGTVNIQVNGNYHKIGGRDIAESSDKRFSEYRRRWKEWPENFQAGEFPLFVDIEVTNACNLKCPFCGTTNNASVMKKGFIDKTLVFKVIDEGAANNLYGVKFNIRGEPLLHPDIHTFVVYAKDRGLIDVYFNTNALLMDEEAAASLIKAGLDRISVSFEGFTKEVYERSRPGSDFEKVISNVKMMQALKKKLGADKPKVRVQSIMLPEISASMEEYKNFWIGTADEIGFLDYKVMKDKKKGIIYPWACPQIWQRMAVFCDGTLMPCNHDDGSQLTFGNIRDVSIKEAWQSEKLSNIRLVHKEGLAHMVPACDGCYLRTSEIGKLVARGS